MVTYTLDYVNHSGFQYTQLYTYNYKDQTMKLTFKAALPCDEEGKLLNQAPGKVDGTALDILPYSQGYYVGNLIFHKAYNMYFSKNFPERKAGTKRFAKSLGKTLFFMLY